MGRLLLSIMAISAPWILATGALAATVALLSARSPHLVPALSGPPPLVGTPDPCPFRAGDRPSQTASVDATARAALPVRHVVVVMQENRSFDHYFGKLAQQGQPHAEGIPAGFYNPDRQGRKVTPYHLPTTCVPEDPPHQWDAMHRQWNGGRMDGFVRVAAGATGDGRHAMGFYDQRDLPFYHWLARTFAISDRHFSSVLGGTWHNRQFLYTGTSRLNGRTGVLADVPTIFDSLDRAGVSWGIFNESREGVRQDCLGWAPDHRGVGHFSDFLRRLADGSLPRVSFVDPADADEHPPNDVQKGEAWFRRIYTAAVRSPLWPGLAIFLTWDEAGGFFDHVPPPAACPPAADRAEFDRLGTRIMLMAISPWARPAHVSHVASDHTALLKFMGLLFDLPALSARDANASSLLDLFDFRAPRLAAPPAAPLAGTGGCPQRQSAPALSDRAMDGP